MLDEHEVRHDADPPTTRATSVRDAAQATYTDRRDSARRITVSVVIPTLNEALNLPHVLPSIPEWVDEIVIVDGLSTDGTIEVVRALRPNAVVVEEMRPGKGIALRAGFHASTGDIIVAMDADGSTNPAELPLFVGALLGGADFVKGSRFAQGGGTDDISLVRRAGNAFLRLTVRLAFGGRYSDLCYGYNAFWRRCLPVIEGDADGFEIETFMNVKVLTSSLNVIEVPSREAPRIHGESNLEVRRDGLRVLRTVLRERIRLRGRETRQVLNRRVADVHPMNAMLGETPVVLTSEHLA